MSWRKPIAPLLAAAALLWGTAGCGFQPLYGEQANAVSEQALAEVRISPLRDRVGQLLHIRLSKNMHPRGPARVAKWDLGIQLISRTEQLGIRKDETATRANLVLEAKFALRDVGTGKPAFQGRSVITISYNILESRFGTVASRSDAERRATRELGDNIKNRVALFLAQRTTASAR
ncbi:MAG: LPS assembly lipoprotein LptE [Alphaproteobacteria bacterium]|nr:LPS assembly lipoprotein LptE [Alphaproteobacteria bacterium]